VFLDYKIRRRLWGAIKPAIQQAHHQRKAGELYWGGDVFKYENINLVIRNQLQLKIWENLLPPLNHQPVPHLESPRPSTLIHKLCITPSRVYDNVASESGGIVTGSEGYFCCIAFDVDLNP